MTAKSKGIAVMAEVVAVLARHSNLRVTPVVEEDRGVVALTVRVAAEGSDGLQVVSMLHELQHVANVAQLRAIVAEYGMDAKQLEAMLPSLLDDAPPHAVRHLTVAEIDACISALGRHELEDSSRDAQREQELVQCALPKLVALGRAMGGAI